jgi:hypothetical protein
MRSVMSPGTLACLSNLEEPSPVPSLDALQADDRQSSELADLLTASAPNLAYGFAVDMHERACESGDGHWSDLWRSVVEILRAGHECRDGRALQRGASPETPAGSLQVVQKVKDRQAQL